VIREVAEADTSWDTLLLLQQQCCMSPLQLSQACSCFSERCSRIRIVYELFSSFRSTNQGLAMTSNKCTVHDAPPLLLAALLLLLLLLRRRCRLLQQTPQNSFD
jgi:uncharacterized protein (TIGR03382 family)